MTLLQVYVHDMKLALLHVVNVQVNHTLRPDPLTTLTVFNTHYYSINMASRRHIRQI